MLEIRTADAPPLTRGFVVFVFSIIWGLFSLAVLYFLEVKIIAVALCAMGLPIWMFLLRKQGKIEKHLSSQNSHFIQARNGFACQKCSNEIKKPIKNQNVQGEPIIYMCENCNILWFVGSVDHSSS
jgi:hypothetical protein